MNLITKEYIKERIQQLDPYHVDDLAELFNSVTFFSKEVIADYEKQDAFSELNSQELQAVVLADLADISDCYFLVDSKLRVIAVQLWLTDKFYIDTNTCTLVYDSFDIGETELQYEFCEALHAEISTKWKEGMNDEN